MSIRIPHGISCIDEAAFAYCSSLKDVFYDGNAAQWGEILIEGNNKELLKAKRHYHYLFISYIGAGETENLNPVEYYGDESILLLPVSKPEYNFAGWYKDSKFTKPITEIPAGTTGTLRLYAKWEPYGYTIAFYANDGSDAKVMQTVALGKTAPLMANSFKRTGYVFQGWNTDADGNGTYYTDKQSVTDLSEENGAIVDLYAQWKTIEYRLTYKNVTEADGNTNPEFYTVESQILLTSPVRPGCTFDGWFSDAKFTKPILEIEKGSIGNKTLYAKWTMYSYTVIFDANGGTGTMKPQAMTCSKTVALTANTFKRTGYVFQGWNTSADGSGTAYANKEKVTDLSKENETLVELFAQWKPIEYKLTYKNVTEADGNVNPKFYTAESEILLTSPSRPGCTFDGWFSDTKFTKPILEIEKGSTGNKTVYAKWTMHRYSVIFDANGGTGTMKPQVMICSKTAALYANKFKRPGYSFAGWLYDGELYANKAKVSNLTLENNAEIVLTAQWAPLTYKITFKNIKSTDENPNPDTFTVESSFPLEAPARQGYIFLGWYTSSGFKAGTEIASVAPGRTANLTLYARWMKE